MKKKWIALLLAAVMGTLSLSGCAGPVSYTHLTLPTN